MGQYFTKETLRRLRNEALITQVIQVLDIPAKTRDGYLRFLCPLCNEFMTACHPKTNLGRCFRCQRNFNPIDLVMVVKGLCFQEAVWFLLDYEKGAQKGGKNAE